MSVAQLTSWGRFDCIGGCCNYLNWASVHPHQLCAHKTNLEIATLRGIPARLEPHEMCKAAGTPGQQRTYHPAQLGGSLSRNRLVPRHTLPGVRQRPVSLAGLREAAQRAALRAAPRGGGKVHGGRGGGGKGGGGYKDVGDFARKQRAQAVVASLGS